MTHEDAPSTVKAVAFSSLHRYGDLFRTYCSDYASLSDLFEGDFTDVDAQARAAARAAGYGRDRETLVRVLKQQNAHWGAQGDALKNIDRLLDPESVAVVTGQQVGLLTGPLYTILKTITAIQVARELERRTGRPCIPVFWLEGEDHDVAEATSVALPTDTGLERFSYEPPKASAGLNAGPVGRLRLDDAFRDFLGKIEAALPSTEFRDAILGAARNSYEAGETLVCGFARYLRTLFPDEGLVFLSPDDPDLKRLLVPLFRREMEDSAGSLEALIRATSQVSERFPAQIHPKEGNVFLLNHEGRVRLEPKDGSFHLRGLDRDLSLDDALRKLESEPESFSANVALRPLAQDTLLPTAIYVAGPGEVAYFAQLKGLYEWAGIPMPVIYPRASATFVEKRIRRVLDRYGLDVPGLSGDVNEVIRKAVLESFDVDVEALFEETEHAIGAAMDKLKPLVEQVDASLGKTVEATSVGLVKQIEGLKGRTIRAAKRQQEQIQEALERASNHLFPDGHLQERTVSPLYLMTKYGPDLPLRWIEQLSTDTASHQIVDV